MSLWSWFCGVLGRVYDDVLEFGRWKWENDYE